jgi:hypothetical protein
VNFQNQNRLPLCPFVNSQNQKRHHHAFVSSQDQNRPTVQIHELLNPKQTHIMRTSKTKRNFNYAFVSSLTFSHFVFSCKVFNLSHPHMPFMIA